MPTADTIAKAQRLIDQKRVRHLPSGSYYVYGDTDRYTVTIRANGDMRCSCPVSTKVECSHRLAVRMVVEADNSNSEEQHTMADKDFAEPIDQERILLFGAAGSGKTTGWMDTALWLQENGDPATFYVIDTDRAVGRMMRGEKYRGLKNLKVAAASNWSELDSLSRKALEAAKPGDWLVIDLIDRAWEYVQQHFTQSVHGQDMDQYMLELREAMEANRKNLAPFEGQTDWQVINKLYKAWSDRTILNTQDVHVFVCAALKSIDARTASEIKEVFGHLGVYPAGQKLLSHQFHTVLYMAQTQSDDAGEVMWRVTTAKDRERKRLNQAALTSFGGQYMAKVAGMVPRGSEDAVAEAKAAAKSADASEQDSGAEQAQAAPAAAAPETTPEPEGYQIPPKRRAKMVQSLLDVEVPQEQIDALLAKVTDEAGDKQMGAYITKQVKELRAAIEERQRQEAAAAAPEDDFSDDDEPSGATPPPEEKTAQSETSGEEHPFGDGGDGGLFDEDTAGGGEKKPLDDGDRPAYNPDGTPNTQEGRDHSAAMDVHAAGVATCEDLIAQYEDGNKDAVEEQYQDIVDDDGPKMLIGFLNANGLRAPQRAELRERLGMGGVEFADMTKAQRLYVAMSAGA